MVLADAAVLNGSDSLPPYATPNPHPSRGVYGFALFLTSLFLLVVYIIWALVPTPWLDSVHITYVPAKYWAVAIPLLFPITVTAFVTFIFAVNLIRFHGIFDNVEVVEKDFGDFTPLDPAELKKFMESRLSSGSASSTSIDTLSGKVSEKDDSVPSDRSETVNDSN